MSTENLEQFMDNVADSPQLQAKIGEKIDAALIALGAECGCEFTAEELQESAELTGEYILWCSRFKGTTEWQRELIGKYKAIREVRKALKNHRQIRLDVSESQRSDCFDDGIESGEPDY